MESLIRLIVLTLLLCVPSLAQNYTFKTIPHPKGADPNSDAGLSITNYGTILMGYLKPGSNQYTTIKVFPTGYTPVPTPPYGQAANMSNTGGISGTCFVNGRLQAFLIRRAGTTFIYSFPGLLIQGGGGMNDYEHKVFSVRNPIGNTFSGLFRDNHNNNTLIDYPGAQWTDASGINNADDVVGDWFDGAISHGYLLHAGQFTSIDVPGAIGTYPMAINNLGHIGGMFIDAANVPHGFILKDGSFTTVDYPVAAGTTLLWTFVNGLNDKGALVGTYLISNPALVNGIERFAFTGVPQ